MRKLILLFLCLFGVGMAYAEEVNIGLASKSPIDVMLGHFFLDNKPRLYEYVEEDQENSDVVVYDYDFNPSTIHFDCENLDYEVSISDCSIETSYIGLYMPISQNFFNADALYEGIAYDVETVIDEWGWEDKTYSNYRVINQNGDVLYTFEAPEGCEQCSGPSFCKVSDDLIIVGMNFYKIEDYTNYRCLYSLKVGQSGVLAPIKQMREMALSANPVTKGDDLVVTVEGNSRETSIMVTALSGMKVKEVPVIEGKAVVGTSDLPCGLYIASQKGGGAAKFIVK